MLTVELALPGTDIQTTEQDGYLRSQARNMEMLAGKPRSSLESSLCSEYGTGIERNVDAIRGCEY